MNPLPLLLLAISLPLLLGGCGEKEAVDHKLIEERDGIAYFLDSDTPYTGKTISLYKNGKLSRERKYKKGKAHGLWVYWHNNGQKYSEGNYKNGKLDGLVSEWFENGQQRLHQTYKDDKPVFRKRWNRKGELEYKDKE